MINKEVHILSEVKPDSWLELVEAEIGKLRVDRFQALPGETWCVLGNNQSGIDQFIELLRPDIEPDSARTRKLPDNLGLVSFKDQQEIFESEVLKDESDFIDRIDPGTQARNFLRESEDTAALVDQFQLSHVLDSGYRQLSSGESRKLLILKAITDGATHLLIENPYDGLDFESCKEFNRIMELLVDQGVNIIIVLSSRSDIPDWCTHLAWIDNGLLTEYGVREEVLKRIDTNYTNDDWKAIFAYTDEHKTDVDTKELIRLVDGHARYSDKTIFSGFNFCVRPGEHTLITGPNGSGKSTLLGLVTGDHQDCYTNELYLFGNRRGGGESIWQIKKQMGIVSPALHREHYVPGSSLQIVLSGFFDSIGLYRKHNKQQQDLARAWLSVTGLLGQEKTSFRRLSFGEQRLVLIIRALIKMPTLLVLDEPTHGLDDVNRASLLDFLEQIAENELSTILYVSHRRDEFRSFFNQHIEFD